MSQGETTEKSRAPRARRHPYSQELRGGGWAVGSEQTQLQEGEGGRALGASPRLSASCQGQARSCSTADWKLEKEGCAQASLGLGPSGPLWPFLSLSSQACTCWWEET